MSGRDDERRRSSLAGFGGAALLALYAFLLLGLSRVLSSNELLTLPVAKHLADADAFARDWYYASPPGARLPFAALAAPLTLAAPLAVVAVVLRVLTWSLLALGIAGVWGRLRLPVGLWVPVLAAFFALGQSLFAGEWLFGLAESKVVAYAAVFFALGWAIDRPDLRAGLAAGLATTFHVLVGGWSTLALGAAVLAHRRDVAPRLGRLAVGLGAGAALGLGLTLPLLTEPAPPPGPVDPLWLYVYFRNPHHLDPATFGWSAPKVAGLVLLAGYLVHRSSSGPTRAVRLTATFALATWAVFGVGLVASVAPGGAQVLHFYPFRVGASAGLLLTLALLARDLNARVADRIDATWQARLRAALTAGLLLAAAPTFWWHAKSFATAPRGARVGPPVVAAPFERAAAWIRDHTPRDAVVIASPAQLEAAVLTERALVVSFKAVPAGKARLLEWYRRLVAFSGGAEPTVRGLAAAEQIDARFRALPPETYRALGEAYGGDVLLVKGRPDLPFPKLFSAEPWQVYALSPPAPGH